MQYQSECLEALKSEAKISKPFEKVFMDTLKLFMAIPGKVNFLQMGRYGEFSEQTYRNNFANETFAFDVKVAVGVEQTKVTCAEETVLGEGVGGSFRILVIAKADVVTLGLDLADYVLRIIGVNPHGGAVDRFSAGAGGIFSAPGVSQQRGRLGHSVADCVRKADLLEPFLDLRINRSAAHNELTYLAAERVDQAFTDLIEYDSVDSGTFVRNLIIGLSSIGLILDLKIFSITSGTVMSW